MDVTSFDYTAAYGWAMLLVAAALGVIYLVRSHHHGRK